MEEQTEENWAKISAEAFQSVASVIQKTHGVFVLIAIAAIIVFVMAIAAATIVVTSVIARSEERLATQHANLSAQQQSFASQLHSLAEGLQIHQNVNIERPMTREDLVREHLRQNSGRVQND